MQSALGFNFDWTSAVSSSHWLVALPDLFLVLHFLFKCWRFFHQFLYGRFWAGCHCAQTGFRSAGWVQRHWRKGAVSSTRFTAVWCRLWRLQRRGMRKLHFNWLVYYLEGTSRCLMCVSCSVHVISTYYVRKGSLAFFLNYPQINKVRKPNHVVRTKHVN